MEYLTGVRYNTSENNIFKWRSIFNEKRGENSKPQNINGCHVKFMKHNYNIIIIQRDNVGIMEMEMIESYLS